MNPRSQRRKVQGSPTLLVVDDDAIFRERLGRAIAGRGYAVCTAANADEAMALATQAPPRYAVLDLRMPGDDGLVLLRRLRELAPDVRVVILTGHGSIATVLEAVHLGAVNYLTKPADVDDLLVALLPEEPLMRKDGQSGAASLATVAWEQIHRLMQACGGDVHEAVRRLGWSSRSLRRRVTRQRLDW